MMDELRKFVLDIIDTWKEAETRINEEWGGDQEETDKMIEEHKQELYRLLKKFRKSMRNNCEK